MNFAASSPMGISRGLLGLRGCALTLLDVNRFVVLLTFVMWCVSVNEGCVCVYVCVCVCICVRVCMYAHVCADVSECV
jgi:hypothetical protein